MAMTVEQKQAYEWAKNQDYQSVAARYAKTLASSVDELQAEIERLQAELKTARAKARKEFAERLKGRNKVYCTNSELLKEMNFVTDNLVKEMEREG